MIEVRALKKTEWTDAMALAWKTFLKFEGDVYDREGIKNFYKFVTSDELEKMFYVGEYICFAAYDDDKIVGVIGMRNHTFLSLLFVDEEYHHCGIGTSLVAQALCYLKEEYGGGTMTVNSSPYAVDFYHHIGFTDIGSEMTKNGITTTPMMMKF